MLNGKINGTHASSFHYQPLATRQVKTWMHVEIASNVINDLQFFDQQIVGPKPTWYNKSVETD